MTGKKWLYIIIIVVLATPVLLIYFSFQGNPIAKFNSKYTLKRHLEQTYPEHEFVVGASFYNFKVGGYEVKAERIGDNGMTDYEFTIIGIFGTKVHYDPIYYESLDRKLIDKLEKEADEEILTKLKIGVAEISEVDATIEVLEGTYPKDTKWDKSLRLEKPLSIWIAINGVGQSRDDVLEIAKTMQKILNDNEYEYDRVMINSQVMYEGEMVLNYSVGFSKNEKLKLKSVEIANEHLDIN